MVSILALMKVETFQDEWVVVKMGSQLNISMTQSVEQHKRFNERKEVSMRRLAKDVGTYSKRDYSICVTPSITVGNLYGLTKEQSYQVIALNWGTATDNV